MSSNNRSKKCINDLATSFENERQEEGEGEVIKKGWGQYLNFSRNHKQIGLYGTSAGLITLSLAERGNSQVLNEASDYLINIFSSLENGKSKKDISQNIRLSFLYLSLRLSRNQEAETSLRKIESELLKRILTSKMWGNYYYDIKRHDNTPREITSAIVVLSFTLFNEGVIHNKVLEVVNKLEEYLKSKEDLGSLEGSLLSSAILTAKKGEIDKDVLSKINKLTRKNKSSFEYSTAYFYEFEYEYEGKVNFGKDYFFITTNILLALADCYSLKSPQLQIFSDLTVNELIKNIEKNQGKYKLAESEKIFSVDQAWAAILLNAYQSTKPNLKLNSRVIYELRKPRSDNILTTNIVPASAIILTLALGVYVGSLGIYFLALTSISNFVVGGLYQERLRKILFLSS